MKINKTTLTFYQLALILNPVFVLLAEEPASIKSAEVCDLSAIKIADQQKRSFIQKRYIDGMEKPLVAKGFIYLNQNNQLELEMIDPEQYKLIFAPDRLYISNLNEDGSYSRRAVNSEEADHLSNFMLSLLGNDHGINNSDALSNYELECKTNERFLISGILKKSSPQYPVLSFKISGKDRPSIIEITDKDQSRLVIEVLSE